MTERMNVTDLRDYVYGAYVRAKNGNTRCTDNLIRYYVEGSKSPSTAHMIFRDEFNKAAKRDNLLRHKTGKSESDVEKEVMKARRYIDNAEHTKKVEPFLKDFTASWKEKYPNTAAKRRFIIDHDFVVCGKVTKNNFINKLWKGFLYGRFLKKL